LKKRIGFAKQCWFRGTGRLIDYAWGQNKNAVLFTVSGHITGPFLYEVFNIGLADTEAKLLEKDKSSAAQFPHNPCKNIK